MASSGGPEPEPAIMLNKPGLEVISPPGRYSQTMTNAEIKINKSQNKMSMCCCSFALVILQNIYFSTFFFNFFRVYGCISSEETFINLCTS